MNNTEQDGGKKKLTPLRIVKTAIKTMLFIILAAIIIVPIWRLIQLDSFPAEMENFTWTDSTRQAYQSSPDSFRVYEISVAQNFTNTKGNSRAGDFFIFHGRLAETDSDALSQIQATIRYNDSTLEHRGEITDMSDEPFVFVLCDDLGNVYEPSKTLSTKKSNLNFRRLVFDGVDMTGVGQLYINIYHSSTYDAESIDTTGGITAEGVEVPAGTDNNAFSTLKIFDSSLTYSEHKLKKKELPA